ncbi:hypothetical protein BMETH_1740_0 [methanotrophic bacterial endosymbiont of Bathymodiolus sp.]|nr:hypothetical protein BMETH_1740_0 [methanotrophic bacterial endosymbiont of Bathymodiolus sp.]
MTIINLGVLMLSVVVHLWIHPLSKGLNSRYLNWPWMASLWCVKLAMEVMSIM